MTHDFKIINNNVLVKEDALTPIEILEILNGHLSFSKAGVVSANDISAKLSRNRRAWEAFLNTDDYINLKNKINRLFDEASKIFNIPYDKSLTTLSVMRYRSSDLGHFDWHEDTVYNEKITAIRKLSMSIILDENYTGGALCFQNLKLENIKSGTCIIFPSTAQHCVEPVTTGVRHSLVAWAHKKNH